MFGPCSFKGSLEVARLRIFRYELGRYTQTETSLPSSWAAGHQKLVSWNGPTPGMLTPCYALSAAGQPEGAPRRGLRGHSLQHPHGRAAPERSSIFANTVSIHPWHGRGGLGAAAARSGGQPAICRAAAAGSSIGRAGGEPAAECTAVSSQSYFRNLLQCGNCWEELFSGMATLWGAPHAWQGFGYVLACIDPLCSRICVLIWVVSRTLAGTSSSITSVMSFPKLGSEGLNSQPGLGGGTAAQSRNPRACRKVCIRECRPLLVIGKGAAYSQADGALRALVDSSGLPFLATAMGRGVVPDSHALNVNPARSAALRGADVAVIFGARCGEGP